MEVRASRMLRQWCGMRVSVCIKLAKTSASPVQVLSEGTNKERQPCVSISCRPVYGRATRKWHCGNKVVSRIE
jgi:hypothetical protein